MLFGVAGLDVQNATVIAVNTIVTGSNPDLTPSPPTNTATPTSSSSSSSGVSAGVIGGAVGGAVAVVAVAAFIAYKVHTAGSHLRPIFRFECIGAICACAAHQPGWAQRKLCLLSLTSSLAPYPHGKTSAGNQAAQAGPPTQQKLHALQSHFLEHPVVCIAEEGLKLATHCRSAPAASGGERTIWKLPRLQSWSPPIEAQW